MRPKLENQSIPEDEFHECQCDYFDRDQSWLEFNRRVLAQALDPDAPLLDRVNFLSIFSSNLDEFFMKRVGLLRQRIASRDADPEAASRAKELLPKIRDLIVDMETAQASAWIAEIRPALAQAGIEILDYETLEPDTRKELDEWYETNVFPILTPLAVDQGHRFPFISNLSENIGVIVGRAGQDESLFARIKIPSTLPRFVPIDDSDTHTRFVPLDEIIRHNLNDLFPGMEVRDVMLFRVTRSAVTNMDDEEADDLLELVESQLRLRRFASAVRVETPLDPSPEILEFIVEELGLSTSDIYPRSGPLEYRALHNIANLPRPDLKAKSWSGITPPALIGERKDIFARIRQRDILLHHPYESFTDSVERFIAEAARDPDVLAIKLTLYRTSRDSPFVTSLIRAAEAGKQVACLVELRARFDEDKNVRFARQLEKAGVHVAYGVVGLKTHCKCSLVVRRERMDGKDALRCYAHLGTGNYHPRTAQLYTDVGLLTADPDITADVVRLFNVLTGRGNPSDYRRLIVAPAYMRDFFMDKIAAERDLAKAGKPGRIIAKMNALEDRQITDALYEASNAGVQIDLIVRGFCCLKPGVPGMSENIRVRSIVGRFLEHSRIFYFGQGAPDPVDGWVGFASADWMYRNLSARVEAMCPIKAREARERMYGILLTMLADRARAWDLDAQGTYTKCVPPADAPKDSVELVGTFLAMMREAKLRRDQAVAEASP
jgi:polyphosphate kinase